jgi:hypothetical protein
MHIPKQEGDCGRAAFEQARAAAGLGLTVTARLGRRTKYQEKALPQMVLLTKSSRPAAGGASDGDDVAAADAMGVEEEEGAAAALPVARPHGSDSILLETTQFAAEPEGEEEDGEEVDGKLHPLEPAVVLALCQEVGSGTRGAEDGGLTSEQVKKGGMWVWVLCVCTCIY